MTQRLGIITELKLTRAVQYFFLTCWLVVALLCTASQAQDKRQSEVDQLFNQYANHSSPGCAVAISKNGTMLYEHGYGMANLEYGAAITPQTIFDVASVSKQFTAAAIFLLAQQGKLSLNDPVRKYLTWFPDFGAPLTIRNLLYHTSGLREFDELLRFSGWRLGNDLVTDSDVIGVMSRQNTLNFRPGERYLYTNTDYQLLALIVKEVTKQSLRQFADEQIFKPLGMNHTRFEDNHAEIVPDLATAYEESRTKHGTFNASPTDSDLIGSTGLLTTVEDLVRWSNNFDRPRVGGPELVSAQLAHGHLDDGSELDYAGGLVWDKYRGVTVVGHSGSDGGYRSMFQRFPNQGVIIVCLCNFPAEEEDLTRKVADIYLSRDLQAVPQVATAAKPSPGAQVSPEDLKRNVGLYWFEDELEADRIVFRDGKLHLLRRGVDLELTTLDREHFRTDVDEMEVTFHPAVDGGMDMTEQMKYRKPDNFKRIPEPTNPRPLADYVGTYWSDELKMAYCVALDNDHLVLTRFKSTPDVLTRAVIPDIFSPSRAAGFRIHFVASEDGRISALQLTAARTRDLRFERKSEEFICH